MVDMSAILGPLKWVAFIVVASGLIDLAVYQFALTKARIEQPSERAARRKASGTGHMAGAVVLLVGGFALTKLL